MEAAKGKDDPVVPKCVQSLQCTPNVQTNFLLFLHRVFLHATDESALSNGVTMDALKKFAAEPEARGGGGSLEGEFPISPSDKAGSMVKETH